MTTPATVRRGLRVRLRDTIVFALGGVEAGTLGTLKVHHTSGNRRLVWVAWDGREGRCYLSVREGEALPAYLESVDDVRP